MTTITAIRKDVADTAQRKSIRFPARSFLAFALTPEAPLEDWLDSLDGWLENSPGFFAGRPVVLDLNMLKPDAMDVAPLVATLAARGIRIYAIEANGVEALGADLPPLLSGARPTVIGDQRVRQETPVAVVATPEPQTSASLTIKTPIRSGQSVHHPNGDVIVLGSVASGSEVIAGGSIHIYGTLRGRAVAGAGGNAEARIFCQRNEAELLAVDGWYRTAEDMEPGSRGKAVQAFLDGDALRIAALN